MFDFFCCAAFLPDSSACYENKNVSLYKTVKGYENSFKEKISKWKILSVLFAVRLFGYSTS